MGQYKDGGPAFPAIKELKGSGDFSDGAWDGFTAHGEYGMSLRDLFAGMAMIGLLADGGRFTDPEIGAAFAYQQADAMLDERENNDGE